MLLCLNSRIFLIMNPNRHRGFTFIELLIVIVIVAILAVLAYPSYDNFIRRARMEEAKASIMNTVRDMERYYSQRRTFVGYGDPADTRFFNIQFVTSNPTADSYEIVANPNNSTNPNETKMIFYSSIGIISRCDIGQTNCEPY